MSEHHKHLHDKFNETGWTCCLMFDLVLSILLIVGSILVLVIFIMRCKSRIQLLNMKRNYAPNTKIIGFFHPNWYVSVLIFNFILFSDAGAGGEKVLWSAVSAIQNAKGSLGKKDTNVRIHIYSGSEMNPEDILE